ncbi:MAG TPA: nuclear transport factor 2 family protein [Iamia sp.]|nr:nuclear transport factor 2 family protein [Iamia sp.]
MSTTDHEQIRHLVHQYAERIDGGDFDAVADLFQHATLVAGDGSEFSGRDTLRDLWAGSVRTYEDGLPDVCHCISNLDVHVADDRSTASARSYVTVMQARPGLPLQAVAVSLHQDTFARVDGTWRFTERRDRQLLVGDLSHHVHGVEPPA